MSEPTPPVVAAPLNEGRLYRQADEFAAALAARQDRATAALERAWRELEPTVREEMAALLSRVLAAQERGERPSMSWVFRQARLDEALAVIAAQVEAYSATAAAIALEAQEEAVEMGLAHATAQGVAAVAPLNAAPGIVATFVAVPDDAVRHLQGLAADGSPLANLFAGMGPAAADDARRALTRGIALGRGPARIVRDLMKTVDLQRHRAVTIVRTETQRVYREASREAFMANDDVVGTWVWTAKLDSRTCPACVAMDGTEHPITESLDGHPRCRCAMVPRTRSWEELLGDDGRGLPDTRPPVRKGVEWLASADAAVQRAVLGPTKYRAWKAGEMELEDVVARTSSSEWGTMRRERSMKEIREGRNANRDDRVRSRRR